MLKSRFSVFSVCFYILILSLLSAGLSAQDTGSGLVFTGCPPYVEGSHCDSMFYQVVAVDISTGKKCPEAKYFIVSGPGEINQKTGLWQFHPEREDLPSRFQDNIEIAAYKGNDTTTTDENCRFYVSVEDRKPRFEGYCGAHMTALPGETILVPLEITDGDYCDEPEITGVEIQPTPSGRFDYDSETWTVTFEPAPADSGITYEVSLSGTSGPSTLSCRIWFDCFEPEPIKIRMEHVSLQEAQPGDTVSVDLIVDDCPADLELAEFSITFDSRLLEYAGATPGAEFFDPDTGCGWSEFRIMYGHECSQSHVATLKLRAQGGGHPSMPPPNCYRPAEVPAVLATLQFVIGEQLEPGPQFIPIDFYWCYCHENHLWSPEPRMMFSASQVMTAGGQLIEPTGIPGRSGASDECFYHGMGSIERCRNVWYQNGGVDLTMPQPPGRYSLRLGIKHDQIQGHFTDLPITLEATDSTQGFRGFDLLFGYDASALVFQMALEGELYSSCGWEYFTYRYGGYGDCGGACPSGMLRVVGLAETNNGQPTAGCDEPYPGNVQPDQLPITLAYLRFLVSNDRNLEGTFIPVSFFWYDCTDNLLSNYDGSRAMLSSHVFDEHDSLISRESEFPTWFGTKDECIDSNSHYDKYVRRDVDYHSGGIQVRVPEPRDTRGDINMNGLAFEIADAVMFANYFIQGLAAFGNHVEGSIAASDCNGDGIPLTVADYIYLYRYMNGEPPTCTYGDSSMSIARFSQDASGVVSVNTPDSLGAIHMIVEGDVSVTLLAEQMDMKFSYWTDSGVTSILVYSFGDKQFLIAGPIISLSAPANIVDVSTATFTGCPVESIIDVPSEPAPYAVQIGVLLDVVAGTTFDVPVTLEKFDADKGLGGFDLLIGYEANQLAFQEARQGTLLDSCGWEYFTYRYIGASDSAGSYPSGLVRLVGMAEISNGATYAGCNEGHAGYVDSAPMTLAYLNFATEYHRSLEYQFSPLRFFWEDCGDNTLSNWDGTELFIESMVDEYCYGPLPRATHFPTIRGAPDSCIYDDQPTGKSAQRMVDFFNGGVEFFGCDSIDARGDINLNGVAWQMADAFMFADYFTQGFAAFGNHVEGSIAASDCNADGIALSVADFVYVVRTVLGDAEPYDRGTPSPNPAFFNLEPLNQEVVLTTSEHLGAVQMVVNGEVTPQLLADQMEISFAWDSGLTRILIYSFEQNVYIEAGRLVALPDATGIAEVETATFLGRRVMAYAGEPSDVDDPFGNLPDAFALHQNYPNPFNPTTTIEYDLPKSSTVRLDIYNVTGQKVRTLHSGQLGAGHQSMEWDGRDGSGRRVSSGIYLYRLTADEFVRTRKMMLLK